MSENTQVKLRPLSLLQIVDRSIRLFRRHFLKFSAIVALALFPLIVISLGQAALMSSELSLGRENYPPVPYSILDAIFYDPVSIVANVAKWLFSLLAVVTLVRASADAYLGRSQGVWETFRDSLRLWGRLLLRLLLLLLLFVGVVVVMVLVVPIPSVGWLLAGLLGGAAIFLALVQFPILIPVVVLEKQSFLGSLRRVWDLVRARFFKTIGSVFLILFLLTVSRPLVGGLTQVLMFGALSLLDIFSLDSFLLSTLLTSLASLLLRLIYTPLLVTLLVLFYFDRRVRAEGLDLVLSAEQSLDVEIDPRVVVFEEAPEPTSGPLLVGREWWFFGGVTLTFVGVCFLLMQLFLLIVETFSAW